MYKAYTIIRYTKEFKEEALKLSVEIGLKQAASQLGLAYHPLAEWRIRLNKVAKSRSTMRSKRFGSVCLNARTQGGRNTNDILKGTLVFFAKTERSEVVRASYFHPRKQ